MRRHAFTLVELLVVIAIISILAALLLPALTRAIDSSRTIACSSQLRQWNLIVMTYTQDNDDVFLTTYNGTADGFVNDTQSTWLAILRPWAEDVTDYRGNPYATWGYLNGGLILCPSYPDGHKGAQLNDRRSYGINAAIGYNNKRLIWSGLSYPHTHNQRPFISKRASSTFLMVENESWAAITQPVDTLPATRHLGKLNFLYLDGHVDSRDPLQVYVNTGGPDWKSVWTESWFPCFEKSPFSGW